MDYSILTAYIIPTEISATKKVNVGDGFILIAAKRLLAPLVPKYEFSTKVVLTDEMVDKINSTKALIVVGSNQLNDKYTIFPKADLNAVKRIKVPIIFMGVGYSGIPEQTVHMSDLTKNILLETHSNVNYSSWRCFRTTKYLTENLPELKDKALMTGCPVIYGEDLLSGKKFTETTNKVAVTVTERGTWFSREKNTLDFVAKQYPNTEKYLVLHQDNREETWKTIFTHLKNWQPPAKAIYWYAKWKGFKVFIPQTAEETQEFYKTVDLHIGSRLHAHLYCLSIVKRSFLTYVDDRMLGISEYMQFPLVDPKNIGQYLGYDFEIYRRNAILNFKTMETFVNYLKNLIKN